MDDKEEDSKIDIVKINLNRVWNIKQKLVKSYLNKTSVFD